MAEGTPPWIIRGYGQYVTAWRADVKTYVAGGLQEQPPAWIDLMLTYAGLHERLEALVPPATPEGR